MKIKFEGWWAENEKEETPKPYENFEVVLIGTEAGDIVDSEDVEKVLECSGYELILKKKNTDSFEQHLAKASKRFEALPEWQKELLSKQVGLQKKEENCGDISITQQEMEDVVKRTKKVLNLQATALNKLQDLYEEFMVSADKELRDLVK